jgi:hypothetical protein
MRATLIILLLLSVSYESFAGIAASNSDTDIQTAINNAIDGETVTIPVGDGTVTWSNGLSIPNTKGIILSGPGAGLTITPDTGATASIQLTHGVGNFTRITGLKFDATGSTDSHWPSGDVINIDGASGADAYRIDNCIFQHSGSGGHPIAIESKAYGVIDNCTFTNSYSCIDVEFRNGTEDDTVWTETADWGSKNFVYAECNTFACVSDDSCTHQQAIDNAFGGRYVFRHNTLTNAWVNTHGSCYNGSVGRSSRAIEAYGNTFTCNQDISTTYVAIRVGGGEATIYDNTIIDSVGSWNYGIMVSYHRANPSNSCVSPFDTDICDGSSAYDENTPEMDGWKCYDQPGVGQNQAASPVYEWDNTKGGGDTDWVVDPSYAGLSDYLQSGRDFKNNTERPAYAPYTYPHPLRATATISGTSF